MQHKLKTTDGRINMYSHCEFRDSDSCLIRQLLVRLNDKGYPLTPDNCTHVVIKENTIVGAFECGNSNFNKETVFRLVWLTTLKDSEGIGSYIVSTAIEIAKKNGFSEIYASYNIKNSKSVYLFNKFKFEKMTSPKYDEIDTRMIIRQ